MPALSSSSRSRALSGRRPAIAVPRHRDGAVAERIREVRSASIVRRWPSSLFLCASPVVNPGPGPRPSGIAIAGPGEQGKQPLIDNTHGLDTEGHFRTDVSYLPDLEAYLADLLRNRERLAATLEADDWATAEAMPSDEEIRRVRRLIARIKSGMEELDGTQRTEIDQAVAVLRRNCQGGVLLGMPRVGPPLTDLRPEQSA
ncbi:hypothetical protein AB0L13_38765 [Saccharopolyspora shandongensis]|uniref:hypothetical protein n=1 Tax=Saccharopolyspora shandongensis TaxID=418495 RepID=UPI00342E85DD